MLRLLPALGLLAGCAAPAAVAPDAGHPASPGAPATPSPVTLAALAPVPAPDVPAVLRPADQPPGGSVAGLDPAPVPHGMDHDMTKHAPEVATEAAVSHTAMNHGRTVAVTPSPTPPEPLGNVLPTPATPISPALDAYLAVHDALAADRFDAEAAAAFEAAVADLVAAAPADDPHLWHRMGAEVEAVLTSARALAEADGLDEGRGAFGLLSVPFAALVEAAGVPEGYDLARHTCGMTDAPEGGVWLQREGPVRNPYFGTGMLMCSRGGEAVGGDEGHEGHGSGH